LVSEDATTDPRSVYAATKLQQERLCVVFGREHGVEVTALRYHNVYGPRMPGNTPYAGVASFFRSALAEGRAPRVFEDGAQLRDFVHVRDVTRATVLAVERPQAYDGPLNIGSGTPRAVLDLARELCAATGSRTCRPIVTGEWRPGDVRHIVASSERARVELGFSAEVGFEAGIEEFARTSLRAAPAES
jgi:dTDP-L-rhamnose 4-epimerase